MKKKGTRKVRKNKRTTQRRKNRSYKRMKGGMFNFKSRGFFASNEPIPKYVKDDIDTYTNEGKLYSRDFEHIIESYNKAINNKDPSKTIYEKNEVEIKDKMKLYTKDTNEVALTTLPISGTSIENLITNLKGLEFLPTAYEFKELYDKFYGINKEGEMVAGKAEKDTKHANPFKFNGFALAVFLLNI